MSSCLPTPQDRRSSNGDIESGSDDDEFFDSQPPPPPPTPSSAQGEFFDSQESPAPGTPSSGRRESFSRDHDKFGTPLQELRRGSEGSIEVEIVKTTEPMRQRLAQTMGFSRRGVMEEIAFQEPIEEQIRKEYIARTRKVIAISTLVLLVGVVTFISVIAFHNQGFENIFTAMNSTEGGIIALAISACLVPLTFILIALSLMMNGKNYGNDYVDQDSVSQYPKTHRSGTFFGRKEEHKSSKSNVSRRVRHLFKGKPAQASSMSLGSSKEGNLAVKADVC